MSVNTLPTFEQNLIEGGKYTSKVWYLFFRNLWAGEVPGNESAVAATGSPLTFTAPSRGFLIVNGGTVSIVQWSRDPLVSSVGRTNYTTGQTQGCFPVSLKDQLIINYTVAPTLTFVPQ